MGRWSPGNDRLDPDTAWAEIYRNLVCFEFPWDLNEALSFALFRTFAVPSIGRLLDQTGEFAHRPQQRYDDTALLLEAPLVAGFDSPDGRAAVRRINRMHHGHDIAEDDLRYVLATFVVVPQRWLADYGWRPLTEIEVRASVRYYTELGRRLGVSDIPPDLAGFATYLDDYEAAHFAVDPSGRRVADATMRLFASFYPRPVRRVIDVVSRSIMDPPLLAAFGYQPPPVVVRQLVTAALRGRSRVTKWLPSRRRPKRVASRRRVRSYPFGFDVRDLGTAAAHGA